MIRRIVLFVAALALGSGLPAAAQSQSERYPGIPGWDGAKLRIPTELAYYSLEDPFYPTHNSIEAYLQPRVASLDDYRRRFITRAAQIGVIVDPQVRQVTLCGRPGLEIDFRSHADSAGFLGQFFEQKRLVVLRGNAALFTSYTHLADDEPIAAAVRWIHAALCHFA